MVLIPLIIFLFVLVIETFSSFFKLKNMRPLYMLQRQIQELKKKEKALNTMGIVENWKSCLTL